MNTLSTVLSKINGKGYKAYKDLLGNYTFENFILYVDSVQGDPFAAPSKIRIRVNNENNFPFSTFDSKEKKMATEDFILRHLSHMIKNIIKGNRGTGNSGNIACQNFGQEILERTAVVITEKYVEARLVIGLPAHGRKVISNEAYDMFFKELPKITDSSLYFSSLDKEKLKKHIETVEDQEFIRRNLEEKDLIAFISDESILPRKSGVSDKPMAKKNVVPFKSPDELRITFFLPNKGKVSGMGIKKGVNIIVGGGYHGKSTLLRAIEKGVYNHIPEDGRDFVVTNNNACKIRAEDGRSINNVNINPFIGNLPYNKNTTEFNSEDASGSTSQAANIIEALELDAEVLLLDEDTSATNFMIRDERMQRLVNKTKEPITPFIDKVEQLYEDYGVSSIIVVGGAGDYFDVADTVIMMDEYVPKDKTQAAKDIAYSCYSSREKEGGKSFGSLKKRIPHKDSFNAFKGKKIKISTKGKNLIQFGRENINLDFIEQLIDANQTSAIGDIIYFCSKHVFDDKIDLNEALDIILGKIEKNGLDIISPFYGQHPGYYSLPRKLEIGAAINRLRTLKIYKYKMREDDINAAK